MSESGMQLITVIFFGVVLNIIAWGTTIKSSIKRQSKRIDYLEKTHAERINYVEKTQLKDYRNLRDYIYEILSKNRED